MKFTVLFPLVLLCLILMPAQPALAGEMGPSLENMFDTLTPGQQVTGVVYLKELVDSFAVQQSMLYPNRLPAEQRHERVIRTLQDTAKFTQKSLVQLLDKYAEQGLVKEYKAFWIVNAISVTATPAVLRELSQHQDVAVVDANRPIQAIRPIKAGKSATAAAGRGVEPGITSTKAPTLWGMGYDGSGVIACNIDTGVDGNHPALASRWRGLQPGVSAAESFFDPVTGWTFPQDGGSHGTHTMGTICGYDGGSNNIGMAPGASWIAAATIDRVDISTTLVDALASFQWCADPDGNPGTYDDVPAVASNSWGLSPDFHSSYTFPGDPYFHAVIDACEAAGCTVVFAAGNEGYYGSETIRTPSDRTDSPVNVLSVGALEINQVTRADFSSMGPSAVDHFTKKPEVMAHGDEVRSAYPGGSYSDNSGTSMACPHVAGAVVLLRDAYPDATAYEIKAALLYTANDLGPAGEDNEYGRGIIDCLAAYNYLNADLIADTQEMSLSSQQVNVFLSMHAGAAQAGEEYIMLGSFSGSAPGTTLPGGLVLPVNWDSLTDKVLAHINVKFFLDFYGTLDANGNGLAAFNLNRPLKPSFIGKTMTYAYCTYPEFDFVSNPVDVDIVP